jgi:hypothetical protein
LFVQFGAECYHTWRAELLSTAAVAVVTYLLTHSSDAQAKASLKTAVLSVAIVLGCFALYHLVRAPWLIERGRVGKHEKEVSELKGEANRIEGDLAAAQAEIARLTNMPDIKGEIIVAFWEVYRDKYEQPWSKHSHYYLKIRLTNHNNVPCTIDRYSIAVANYHNHKNGGGDGIPSSIGKLNHPTFNYTDESTEVIETSNAIETRTWMHPIDISPQWPLERGCKHEGWVTFVVWNYVPSSIQADDVAPEGHVGPWQECLTVSVLDSLGNTHPITDVIANVGAARLESS